MSRVPIRSRLRIDPYIVALLATVAVASLLPARGVVALGFDYTTTIAIGFLFFLYGARLSTKQALDGLKHWRLHSVVFASTFLLFPLLGTAAKLLVPGVLTPELYAGLMFLCSVGAPRRRHSPTFRDIMRHAGTPTTCTNGTCRHPTTPTDTISRWLLTSGFGVEPDGGRTHAATNLLRLESGRRAPIDEEQMNQ